MSPQHTPAPQGVVRRRRRRSSRRYLYYSAVVCGLILISIPLAHDYYLRVQRGRAVEAGPEKSSDLVLSEAGFREEGGKPYIAGVLKNQSKKTYRNIELLLLLRSISGSTIGTMTVNVKELKPESSTEFRTAPLPEGAARFSLRDVSGTPQ